MHVPVSSTSSTFTLPSLPVSSRDVATTTTSTSTLPPISSLMSTAVRISPIQSSSIIPSSSSCTTNLPFLPQAAVATSSHLQQYSAVRQLTSDLQQRNSRNAKRPQLPPGEAGTPVRRIVHTAIYKHKLNQYNYTLKLYENHINELLKQTTAELDKIITKVDSVVIKL